MAFTTDDLIDGLHGSRQHFLKHISGLREDQWDWRPFPECKTARETLAHLICDDRAALQALQTGGEPDYEALQEAERDLARLQSLLADTHEQLCAFLRDRHADSPMDAEVSAFGTPMKLGRAIAYLSSEDFYHAGQVAFIRQATDPAWDYYSAIYG